MPKREKYVQHYKLSWEAEPEFKGWLAACPGDGTKAFCKACKRTFRAHKNTLLDHKKSDIHKLNTDKSLIKITDQPGFSVTIDSKQTKINELKISTYIAEHSAINSVDHLSELIVSMDLNSNVLSKIKLHRTKCTKLIQNIIAPEIRSEIIKDLNESKAHFSLIFDESTDIGTQKLLCIMLIYFSKKTNKIVTTFYKIIKLLSGDANTIYSSIKKTLIEDMIDLKKLVGIGVDGANVNVGSKNSVYTLLKKDLPDLILIKCVCHSLSLASKYAFEKLPRHLDHIIMETYNWFSRSTKRQEEYKNLYETINNNCPLKILKFCETRWLSRSQCMERILENWDVLKLHFQLTKDKEHCYNTLNLATLYSDPINKLYFTAVVPIVKSIAKVNKLFQIDANYKQITAMEDLLNLYKTLLDIICVPTQLKRVNLKEIVDFKFENYLLGENYVHLGYEYSVEENIVKTCLSSKGTNPLPLIAETRKRIYLFIVEMCSQIKLRLPNNIAVYKQLNFLTPQNASAIFSPDITELVVEHKHLVNNVSETLKEWKLLSQKKYNNMDNPIEYWNEVSGDIAADGTSRFKNISLLALALYSLPISNASVERVFSTVNVVKNKLRNRMNVITLDSILAIRHGLKWRNQTCKNFIVTNSMLNKFNSNIYNNSSSDLENDDAGIEEIITAISYE